MAKTGYIYKITSPTNKIYVGKTVNLSTRKSYYRSNNNKSQKIISNSFFLTSQKKENFIIEKSIAKKKIQAWKTLKKQACGDEIQEEE